MPEGVDPALLGIWSSIGLSGNAQPAPLDPGLVGYWQAKGELNGRPAIFVWRIGDAGYAVLTVISTLDGELTAENGELSVEPGDGEELRRDLQAAGARHVRNDRRNRNDPLAAARHRHRSGLNRTGDARRRMRLTRTRCSPRHSAVARAGRPLPSRRVSRLRLAMRPVSFGSTRISASLGSAAASACARRRPWPGPGGGCRR